MKQLWVDYIVETIVTSRILGSVSALPLLLGLAACGGGGGTVETISDGGGTFVPTTAPTDDRASLSQAERDISWAYRVVGGEAAFDADARGQGTLIAMVDSGVSDVSAFDDDNDSVDFDDNLDPRRADVGGGQVLSSGSGVDGLDSRFHGNYVASIMVSRVDGRLLAGIAPEASLLSIDADNSCGPGCYEIEDVAVSVRYAAQADADVLNLSLGGDTTGNAELDALRFAASSGTVIVSAAGNDGGILDYPARYVLANGVEGSMVVVGAVDRNLEISDFSARPASQGQAEFFMVAPGENIPAVNFEGRVDRASGTSFATAFVSAGIAALKSKFPFLSAEELVDLVLRTASDLGAPGTDLIYGRGLLDLETAVQPVGELSLPQRSGSSIEVASSEARFGPAFGDAGASAAAFESAVALDDFGRAYQAGLGEQISMSNAPSLLDSRLFDERQDQLYAGQAFGKGFLQFSQSQSETQSEFSAFNETRSDDDQQTQMQWRGEIRGGVSAKVGFDVDASANALTSASDNQLFSLTGSMRSPASSLASEGLGFAFEGERVAVALHQGETTQGGGSGTIIQTRFQAMEGVDLTHSLVDEKGAGLGSEATGGLSGLGDSAQSQFLTLGLSKTWLNTAFGLDATMGMSDMADQGGSVGDWSKVWSSAFAASAVSNDVFAKGDTLGFLVGQPLRVESGSVRADLPVSQRSDGSLVFVNERIEMSPSGRELRLDMVYSYETGEQMSIQPWASLRHEPGHRQDADDEALLGLNMKVRW